jgi:MFS family permease
MVGFNTFGFVNAYGVLQSYYVSRFDLPPSTVSWIGSLSAFLVLFISTFSGRLTDAGYFHQTLLLGTILQLLGFFAASFAKTYWQVLVAHGVCIGVGGGLIFIPAISLVGTYFTTRRSLALAICAVGNSFGGLIFSAILQSLLPKLGYGWAMRVCGFVIMGSMIPANFLLKPRRIKRNKAPLIEWSAFGEPVYACFSVGMFFGMVGMWIPVFYVSLPLSPSTIFDKEISAWIFWKRYHTYWDERRFVFIAYNQRCRYLWARHPRHRSSEIRTLESHDSSESSLRADPLLLGGSQ